MRVLPALFCALVLTTGLAGCGSSNDGSRDADTGTSIVSGSTRIGGQPQFGIPGRPGQWGQAQVLGPGAASGQQGQESQRCNLTKLQ